MNENAFASIVQARPCPTFGRPVPRRGSPHRLQPGTAPHALRIPPRGGHPALRRTTGCGFRSALACIQLSLSCPFRLLHAFHLPRPARHYPRVWIRRSSSERRRDFNPPERRAAQRTLRTPRTPSRLRETSAVRSYTHGLCPTRLPGRVSPVPRCSFPTCHRSKPRGGPASHPVAGCCLLPSPCYERLDPPEHLSADNVTRLMRSLSLRPAALLPSLSKAFDTPLRTVGSLLPPGVCYRALRRLPGRDFHPLEHRVFVQDAP